MATVYRWVPASHYGQVAAGRASKPRNQEPSMAAILSWPEPEEEQQPAAGAAEPASNPDRFLSETHDKYAYYVRQPATAGGACGAGAGGAGATAAAAAAGGGGCCGGAAGAGAGAAAAGAGFAGAAGAAGANGMGCQPAYVCYMAGDAAAAAAAGAPGATAGYIYSTANGQQQQVQQQAYASGGAAGAVNCYGYGGAAAAPGAVNTSAATAGASQSAYYKVSNASVATGTAGGASVAQRSPRSTEGGSQYATGAGVAQQVQLQQQQQQTSWQQTQQVQQQASWQQQQQQQQAAAGQGMQAGQVYGRTTNAVVPPRAGSQAGFGADGAAGAAAAPGQGGEAKGEEGDPTARPTVNPRSRPRTASGRGRTRGGHAPKAQTIKKPRSKPVTKVADYTGPAEDAAWKRRVLQRQRARELKEQQKRRVQTSRFLPDSSFKTVFNKTVFHNYGNKNIRPVSGGVAFGDYLCSHNINPMLHPPTERQKLVQSRQVARGAVRFYRTRVNDGVPLPHSPKPEYYNKDGDFVFPTIAQLRSQDPTDPYYGADPYEENQMFDGSIGRYELSEEQVRAWEAAQAAREAGTAEARPRTAPPPPPAPQPSRMPTPPVRAVAPPRPPSAASAGLGAGAGAGGVSSSQQIVTTTTSYQQGGSGSDNFGVIRVPATSARPARRPATASSASRRSAASGGRVVSTTEVRQVRTSAVSGRPSSARVVRTTTSNALPVQWGAAAGITYPESDHVADCLIQVRE